MRLSHRLTKEYTLKACTPNCLRNGALCSYILPLSFGTNLRWPRELNALQLQKTHANRKSTSKSRKHLHQFDSRWCKCSQHNQINFICSVFLCLVVLWAFAPPAVKLMKMFSWFAGACQIDESYFLNLQAFFFYLHCVSLFGFVVSICSLCVVKLTKVIS